MKYPRIERWAVARIDLYAAPEQIIEYLTGNVYGHPRVEEGRFVCTSYIKEVKNGRVVTGSGTEYELGEPHPEYEKTFPDAKQRLLDNEVE